MPGDGLTLAVGVGREIYLIGFAAAACCIFSITSRFSAWTT